MVEHFFCNYRPRFVARYLLAFAVLASTASHASITLSTITDRGQVRCGVPVEMPGFAAIGEDQRIQGLNVDYCRAIAAATLGAADAVDIVPVSLADGPSALLASDIDVLVHRAPWTLTLDAEMAEPVGVMFHDGQGFLVRKQTGYGSALQLNRDTVCVIRQSNYHRTAQYFFKLNRVSIAFRQYRNWSRAVSAYAAGKCSVLTANRTTLAIARATLQRPGDHQLLPEMISKAPYGPIVRHQDSAWIDITRWVLNCWITAEEQGIARDSANRHLRSSSPAVRRLLGRQDDVGGSLGLSPNWCYNVIALVGHYGESYQRHVADSDLALPRGINALWNNGGILYAPPLR